METVEEVEDRLRNLASGAILAAVLGIDVIRRALRAIEERRELLDMVKAYAGHIGYPANDLIAKCEAP